MIFNRFIYGIDTFKVIKIILFILLSFIVGLLLFNYFQKYTNDTKRKQDVQNIVIAIESSLIENKGIYDNLKVDLFKNGVVPKDPYENKYKCNSNYCVYCIRSSHDYCTVNNTKVAEGIQPESKFTICANLESGGYYCLSNVR